MDDLPDTSIPQRFDGTWGLGSWVQPTARRLTSACSVCGLWSAPPRREDSSR